MEKQECLSFDSFSHYIKNAYFIKASNYAWPQLDPLVYDFVSKNNISNTFGLSAFIMPIPANNPSIDKACAHQQRS
jgi:hypothetical protein